MKTVNFNSHKQDVRIDVMVLFLTTVRRVWISQLFCQRFSVVWVGVLFYAGSHDFSFHLFLTCVCCLHKACGFESPLVPPLNSWLSLCLPSILSTPLTSSLPLLHPAPRLTPKPDQLASDASFQEPWEARLHTPFLLLSLGLLRAESRGCGGFGEEDPWWIGHALCDLARPGAAWTSLGCQSWLQKVLKILPICNPWPKKQNTHTQKEKCLMSEVAEEEMISEFWTSVCRIICFETR